MCSQVTLKHVLGSWRAFELFSNERVLNTFFVKDFKRDRLNLFSSVESVNPSIDEWGKSCAMSWVWCASAVLNGYLATENSNASAGSD